VPLIFEAVDLPADPTWTYPRNNLPPMWNSWVQDYRAEFQRRGIDAAWVTDRLIGPSYIAADVQEELIDYLLENQVDIRPPRAGNYVYEWAAARQREAQLQQQRVDHEQSLRRLRQQEDRRRNSQRLSELPGADVESYTRWMVAELEHPQHGWSGWPNLRETIADPVGLVRGFVTSFRNNQFEHTAFTRSYMVLINGDVQRGKSLVESLYVVLARLMCQDPRVSDRPCTLLGTGMVLWARALHAGVGRLAGEFMHDASRLEQQARDELLQDGQPGGIVVTVSGSTDDDLMRVMRVGGVVVFARTATQIGRVQRVAERLLDEQVRVGEVVTSFNLVLDEADMMLGSGEDDFKYEQALRALENALRPSLYVRVSATNELSVLDAMRRCIDQERPMFEMLQIESFLAPAPDTYMANFQPPRDAQGHPVYLNTGPSTTPLAADDYVCSAVMHVYEDIVARPFACGVDSLARGVSYSTDHNMQDHVQAVVDELESRTGEQMANMAFVVVHGSHTAHDGMIGVRLVGPDAEARAELLRREVERVSGQQTPTLVNQHGYIEQEMLRPLLEDVDEQAGACAALFDRQHVRLCPDAPRAMLSTVQLPLTLFVLRHFFDGIPISIVIGGMARRCLSIIAPNFLRQHEHEREVLLCVTHTICTATEATNAADVVQKFQRAATTATAFYALHGFDEIQVLAPARLWNLVRAAVAFNRNAGWLRRIENWRACKFEMCCYRFPSPLSSSSKANADAYPLLINSPRRNRRWCRPAPGHAWPLPHARRGGPALRGCEPDAQERTPYHRHGT